MIDLSQVYGFGNIGSLGEGLQRLVGPAFTIATIAVLFYFLLGAFGYLTSGGDKQATSNAQNQITHAIIGFLLLMVMFLILKFIPEFLGLNGFGIIR